MSDDMTKKYQKHYNQLISDTLNDLLIKNISFQANIKLANEIISEQEESIKSLNESLETTKGDLENTKKSKNDNSNAQITSLENRIKSLNDTITKLNTDLTVAKRVANDYETLKSQVSNIETFRNQLVKERDAHQQTKTESEQIINDLKNQIESLQNPPKKKRTAKVNTIFIETPEQTEQQPTEVATEVVRDGGSF